MLFVSQKEPLTSETLPDTSLHNELRQQASASSAHSPSSSTAFFQSPAPCVSKLTKEQFDLHREFLRLGSLLMAENVDLFHNALTVLSAKHGLKTATPATCVSDIIPVSHIGRHYSKPTVATDMVAPRASNRKYVLPKEIADKEFYQCMVCKERRATNSFGSSHTHDDSARPNIRWYCPLCDSFFAVTHRGYHVKSRHSDVLTIAQPMAVAEQMPTAPVDPASLKRSSDESNDEDHLTVFEHLSPPEKVHIAAYPSPSTASVDSMVSSCLSDTESQEDRFSPSVESMLSLSACQRDAFSFNDDAEDNNCLEMFPLHQNHDDIFATSPASPFSV